MVESNLVTKEYLDITLDRRFSEFEARLEAKFDDFALSVANGFKEIRLDLYETERRMHERFDILEHRVTLIEGHIGRMEVRFGYLDDMVRNDHAPRLRNLEIDAGFYE